MALLQALEDFGHCLTMPVKFVDKFKVGFQVVVEAREGFLLGGRTISDNVVCDTFFEALAYMNAVIEDNVNADRRVRIGKVLEFRGLVSTAVFVPESGEHEDRSPDNKESPKARLVLVPVWHARAHPWGI